MASDLQSFLMKGDVVVKTKQITVPLLDGTMVEIDIREIPQQQIARLQSRNTKSFPPVEGSPIATTGMDNTAFCVDICAGGITSPDLKDSQLMQYYNVTKVDDLLFQLFSLNTIADIANQIVELSLEDSKEVTNATDPKLVKQAKNS